MKVRIRHDPEAGWWHYEVRGYWHGFRVTGSRRTRQDAVDEAIERGWKFCVSDKQLAEAGALPLDERQGFVTVEEA